MFPGRFFSWLGLLAVKPAEEAAESVGRKVRGLMQEISGVAPENLPISEDIRQVRSRLKGSHKEFKKMDRASKG